MIYDHIVKANGVYYPAGSEVPGPEPEKETPKAEEKAVETETAKRGRPKKK